MDFLANLSLGFSVALTPFNLLMAACGVVLGILIGALPGIGPPSGVALVALLDTLGMVVGTALFLVVLLRGLDRVSWPVSVAVALATAAFTFLVFTWWLKVPLPVGVLGF